MGKHNAYGLKSPLEVPTNDVLAVVLGNSFAAYEVLQATLPQLDIEQHWQWYTPYNAWFAKGNHGWTTPKGTRKETNLYWLYPYQGYFRMALWFLEKHRGELLSAEVSEATKQIILDSRTQGKMATFPVALDVTTPENLADILVLIEWKKRLKK